MKAETTRLGMIPTVEYIQSQYGRFNSLIFEGRLPDVPIKPSRAKTFLGRVEYKTKRGLFGVVTRHTGFVLKFSTHYDIPEEEVQDTVIHEMIHLYIAYFNVHDTSSHGRVFRTMMKEINENYGRNVSISYKGTQGEIQDKTIRQHIICVTEFSATRHGITVCSESKVRQIKADLPKRYRYLSARWYTSTDPYFNRYPRSISAKIYSITEEMLALHLKDAEELAPGLEGLLSGV